MSYNMRWETATQVQVKVIGALRWHKNGPTCYPTIEKQVHELDCLKQFLHIRDEIMGEQNGS